MSACLCSHNNDDLYEQIMGGVWYCKSLMKYVDRMDPAVLCPFFRKCKKGKVDPVLN
jgi:hypothetical protein